jgi:hypothetical protein
MNHEPTCFGITAFYHLDHRFSRLPLAWCGDRRLATSTLATSCGSPNVKSISSVRRRQGHRRVESSRPATACSPPVAAIIEARLSGVGVTRIARDFSVGVGTV